jgi:hypothetical protein
MPSSQVIGDSTGRNVQGKVQQQSSSSQIEPMTTSGRNRVKNPDCNTQYPSNRAVRPTTDRRCQPHLAEEAARRHSQSSMCNMHMHLTIQYAQSGPPQEPARPRKELV